MPEDPQVRLRRLPAQTGSWPPTWMAPYMDCPPGSCLRPTLLLVCITMTLQQVLGFQHDCSTLLLLLAVQAAHHNSPLPCRMRLANGTSLAGGWPGTSQSSATTTPNLAGRGPASRLKTMWLPPMWTTASSGSRTTSRAGSSTCAPTWALMGGALTLSRATVSWAAWCRAWALLCCQVPAWCCTQAALRCLVGMLRLSRAAWCSDFVKVSKGLLGAGHVCAFEW